MSTYGRADAFPTFRQLTWLPKEAHNKLTHVISLFGKKMSGVMFASFLPISKLSF